jgi:hypothetical protein
LRDGHDDDKQNPRQRGSIAHLTVSESVVVDMHHVSMRRVVRTASGQDMRLHENLESSDNPHDQVEIERGRDQRKRDSRHFDESVSPVDFGAFI